MTFHLAAGKEGRLTLKAMMLHVDALAELNGLFASGSGKEWADALPFCEAVGVGASSEEGQKEVEPKSTPLNLPPYSPSESLYTCQQAVTPPPSYSSCVSPTTAEKRRLEARSPSPSSTSTTSSSSSSSTSSSSSEGSVRSQPSPAAARRHPPVVACVQRSQSMKRDWPARRGARAEKSPVRKRRGLKSMAEAFRDLGAQPIMRKVKDRRTGQFTLRPRTPSPQQITALRREDRLATESTPVPGGRKVAELPAHWQADVTKSPSKEEATTVEKIFHGSMAQE